MNHSCLPAALYLLVVACGDDGAEPKLDAGSCDDDSPVTITLSVPTQGTVTSDLTVYGSLRVPPTASVFGVFVGVGSAPLTPKQVPSGSMPGC